MAKQRRSRYEPGKRVSVLAQAQGAAGAGAGGRRLDAGGGERGELGALVVGVYEGERLRFAGKVGSGFDARARRRLREALGPLETEASPFDPPPPADYRGRWGGDLAGVRWTRPELVIRAALGGWSRDGQVRQGSFKGMEAGRDPREVVREQAIDPADAEAGGGRRAVGRDRGRAVGRERPMLRRSPSADPSWLVTDAELASLVAMRAEGPWQVAGQELQAHQPRQGPLPAPGRC